MLKAMGNTLGFDGKAKDKRDRISS